MNKSAIYAVFEAGKIAGERAWLAVAHKPNASPLGVVVKGSADVQRNDSWRDDEKAADWNVFVPELEALNQRIELLKP